MAFEKAITLSPHLGEFQWGDELIASKPTELLLGQSAHSA
jgi:hypothetical protein